MPNLSLHNQTLLGNDDFVANFVARHEVLDALLRRLEVAADGSTTHHDVIIGPRGMGKTSLLRRAAIAITHDEAMSRRLVPLRFREEQYNVLSLGDFWRNCGEALAEWADEADLTALADRLDRSLASGTWAGDDAAAEQFAGEMAALHRRAVLMVDNLDLILDALSANDHWKLRRHLQARDGPIMIGAATQPLKDSSDRDAAFYQFFQPHYLEPLSEPEAEACMRALANRRGSKGNAVQRVLDDQPERLKTLHTLTGGNPRVLTLIYRLLETTESEAAMADLELLLDQVTPYYKARIEDYQTAQQRAVIDAIALRWDPITTSDLSRATSIVSTTLSPLLIKLRKDGLIETVETSGSYAGHQLVERFLNIWYLMRHGTRRTKQKMRWLVGFLESFYSPTDLVEIDSRARAEGFIKDWTRDYADAFEEALARRTVTRSADRVREPKQERTHRLLQMARDANDKEDFPLCRTLLGELLAELEDADADAEVAERIAGILFDIAMIYQREGNDEAEIAAYGRLIERFDHRQEPAFRGLIASALTDQGIALGHLGNPVAEMVKYDEVIVRFSNDPEVGTRIAVSTALFNKAVTFDTLGEPERELATYDEVIARFGDDDNVGVQLNVLSALDYKALTFGQRGNYAMTVAIYDDLLARFDDNDDPRVATQAADARFRRAVATGRLGDRQSEIAQYDALVERVSSIDEPWAYDLIADAVGNKVAVLIEQEDNNAILVALDQRLAALARLDGPAVRDQIALSLVNKGVALGRLGHLRAQIDAYDEVVRRFSDVGQEEELVRERVLAALMNKAAAIASTGDLVGQSETYDLALSMFGEDQGTGVRQRLVPILLIKADQLDQADRGIAAIAAYEKIVDYSRPADGESLDPLGAHVRIKLANLLFDLRVQIEPAEQLLIEAAVAAPLMAHANLAWLYLLSDRIDEAAMLRQELDALPASGLAILDAGFQLVGENFGTATDHLALALNGELVSDEISFDDDLRRLLRLAAAKGFGQRLLAWFDQTGAADRLAPLYVAFKAYVQSERVLLDSNPEVRQLAKVIFDQLDAPRHQRDGAAALAGRAKPDGSSRRNK